MNNKRLKVLLFIFSFSIFCYHLFHLITLWTNIPDRIAIHFTNDTPDNWGPKYILIIMPLLSMILWNLIGLFAKNPEKMNYVNLTDANKEMQYARAEKVMILMQNFGSLSLIFANDALLKHSVGIDSSLPIIISLTLLGICFIAPIYLFIWAATLKY